MLSQVKFACKNKSRTLGDTGYCITELCILLHVVSTKSQFHSLLYSKMDVMHKLCNGKCVNDVICCPPSRKIITRFCLPQQVGIPYNLYDSSIKMFSRKLSGYVDGLCCIHFFVFCAYYSGTL